MLAFNNSVMLIRRFLIFFFFAISIAVYSQNGKYPNAENNPAIGKIKGTVVDSKTKQPIQFATISLYKFKDSSLVTGAVANDKGVYELSSLGYGRYFMKVKFIGYKQIIIDTIAIRPRAPEVTIGTLRLQSNSEQLGEVEVSSEKSTIQLGIDRKIFNVEKSIVSEGGSAADVLQSIPSVSVDIDGNVSLRGSGNITVLVDGKPSGITGSSRAAILEQIPASSIESIELITNPSAKYDPDGMGGIINIVLKKNKLSGFNGSVSIGAGTNDKYGSGFNINKYNASINLSYRNSRFNSYINYGYRVNTRTHLGISERQNIFPDTSYFLNEESFSSNKNTSNNIKGGIDFYLNPKNTLGFSVLYNTGKESGTGFSKYTEADKYENLSASYVRDETSGDSPKSTDYNINYRKIFNKPKQELIVDGTYSMSDGNDVENYSDRDYELKYASKNSTPFKQNTSTEGINSITNIQLDYVQPLKNQMKLELGAKTTLRDIQNDFVSTTYDYSNSEFVADTDLNNNFQYNENIFAAYATFSGMIKTFGYQVGLRGESANTISKLLTTNEKFSSDYLNLFPSVHLSKKFSKEQELQISYSRRVNRPNMRTLNPFKDYADPYNIRYGNPYLKPEYINSYELSYVKYWKKSVLTSSIYYRKTDGIIQRYKTVTDSLVSFTTFVNLNSSTSYGFELISKNDLTKWWNITTSVNVFETKIDGNNVQADLQNNNFSYMLKLLSNMHVWKNLDIQFVANYRGPMATAQGKVEGVFTMDIGAKKEIFRNATLSLNVSDITNSRKMKMKASDTNFIQTMEHSRESRIVTLTFAYRFGKLSDPTKKPRQNKQNNGGEFEGGEDMGM